MPITLREEILALIQVRFMRITPAHGYRTSLGTHVRYGQWPDPVPKTLPALAFADVNEVPAPGWGAASRMMQVTITAYDRTRGKAASAVANPLLADIDTALHQNPVTGQVDWSFGGLVQKVVFDGATILTYPGAVPLAGVAAHYRFIYSPVLGDPYTAND